MRYPFPWITIEGCNGSGKSTLHAGLRAALRDRGHFSHDPPKEGPWADIFKQLRTCDKLERRPDVMMTYLACSLRHQNELVEQPVNFLISDRSFLSTLAYFSNIPMAVRQDLVRFHYLPHRIVYLHDDVEVIEARLRERADAEEQIRFNAFYAPGYDQALAWAERRDVDILRMKSSDFTAEGLCREALGHIRQTIDS